MNSPRSVTTARAGSVLSLLGLITGAAAFMSGTNPAGIMAAVLALIAGGFCFYLGRSLQDQAAAQTLMENELRTLRAARDKANKNLAAPPAALGPTARPTPKVGLLSDQPRIINDDSADAAGNDSSSGQTAEDSTPPGHAMVDPETSLFSEGFFQVALESRIAAARRHLRPVAMVLIEVVQGLPEAEPSPVEANLVAKTIKTTLREADTACRLESGHFALLLEDTPENGAIWTVERIRRQLAESRSGMTMWAGVACYPAHALSTEKLLEAASQALVTARDWRQDRIEVAIAAE